MTDVVEQTTVRKSALDELHSRLGAVLTQRDGWSVPASYDNQSSEYDAVRELGAGLIDMSSRGRLIVGGSEAVSFLNGLITNDMKTLEEGHWMAAAFPNVQGRLIASVRVLRGKDDSTGKNGSPTFLIDTETVTHEAVVSILERFTLAGDFRVTDLTRDVALLSLQGKDSQRLIRDTLGETAAGIGRNETNQVEWLEGQVTVIRATHTAEDGFDMFVSAQNAEDLWTAFLRAGACPVGFDALEVLRIEAGQARYGIDMDDTNVVSETNLDDAVSFTKGCYIGQEIIARIKYRGHVAKKLTGIMFERAVRIEGGARLLSQEDKEIGRLTSVTYSPHLERTIGLAYVKYDYLAPGTSVKVGSGEEHIGAIVSQLPLVSGSWYDK